MSSTLTHCFLIGGAPLTGKSTLGSKIASNECAMLLSTDAVQDWLQHLVDEKSLPDLFFRKGASDNEFYRKYDTSEKLLEAKKSQSKLVADAISVMLKSKYVTWERLVIEGLAITPEFANEITDQLEAAKVTTTFLFDDNETRIRQRLTQRGLWGNDSVKSEDIVRREIAWIVHYNAFYKEESERYGFSLTSVNNKLT